MDTDTGLSSLEIKCMCKGHAARICSPSSSLRNVIIKDSHFPLLWILINSTIVGKLYIHQTREGYVENAMISLIEHLLQREACVTECGGPSIR